MRECGVLMPVFSLPSKYGIGCFSKEAYTFIDRLKKANQKYWQLLPLGPTSYGDSPYQSFSAYAGNPYFIDLENLVEIGLLKEEECNASIFDENNDYIDYEKLYLTRFDILRKAFVRFDQQTDAYVQFKREEKEWLEDYALFMAIKNLYQGKSWLEWHEDIKCRKPKVLDRYKQENKEEIEFVCFQQFMFQQQWKKLKAYANKQGIKIIGDIPIYAALDSADVWADKKLFQFDDDALPVAVAGCPPDAFAVTGQLWGNPLYDWKYHKQTDYEWWTKRIAQSFKLYDVVRVDHFRGFDEYYSIPYGDKTAEHGTWVKGPGYDIFDALTKHLGSLNIIAEDLGYLTPSVIELVKRTGFPGMKILQFAFDSREESDYLPHNYERNCVVYSGTHDNDTILGWYRNLPKKDKDLAKRYVELNMVRKEEISWKFIRLAMGSVANLCIIPIQDYLGLGSEARINTPSTLGQNWRWRLAKGAFSDDLCDRIREITLTFGR